MTKATMTIGHDRSKCRNAAGIACAGSSYDEALLDLSSWSGSYDGRGSASIKLRVSRGCMPTGIARRIAASSNVTGMSLLTAQVEWARCRVLDQLIPYVQVHSVRHVWCSDA